MLLSGSPRSPRGQRWPGRELGFRDLDAAVLWRDGRFSPERARTWSAISDTPSAANAWSRLLADDASVAEQWREAGCASAGDAAPFVKAGLAVSDVASWRAAGVANADEIVAWATRWSVATAAEWTQALGQSIDAAWGWHEFTNGELPEASRWLKSGVPTAVNAATWLAGGFTAVDAQLWSSHGFDVDDAAVWAAGEYAPEDAASWRNALSHAHERPLPALADAWRSLGIHLVDAIDWLATDVRDPMRALSLSSIGLSAGAYDELRKEHSAAQLPAALRRQAVTYAGLGLEDDIVTLDITGEGVDLIPSAVSEVVSAAARAGEAAVKIRHGWPHLTPDAIAAIPDARYVRGGEKVSLLRMLAASGPAELRVGISSESAWSIVDGGNSTLLPLSPPADGTTEFLIRPASVPV